MRLRYLVPVVVVCVAITPVFAGASFETVGDVSACSTDAAFQSLDYEVDLRGHAAESSEEITAEVMGTPELTSISLGDVQSPIDAAVLGIKPHVDVAPRPGLQGVRAVVFDSEGNPTIVLSPEAPDPDIASLPSLAGVKVDILRSCIPTKDIQAVRLLVEESFDRAAVIAYVPFNDRVMIASDEKWELIERTVSMLHGRVDVVHQEVGLFSRPSDAAPHYAGAVIKNNQTNNYCSSGYKVWSSAYGAFALSAGHCGDLNQTFNSGGNFYGTVMADAPNPDVLMMNGSTYTGRTYSENDDTSWRAINGTAVPSTNQSYCNNGAFSRETCANPWSVDAEFLVPSAGVTIPHLIVQKRECAWGILGRPGDSGGPLNKQLSDGRQAATGIVIGGLPANGLQSSCSGETMLFSVRWDSIANLWGLSIVNG